MWIHHEFFLLVDSLEVIRVVLRTRAADLPDWEKVAPDSLKRTRRIRRIVSPLNQLFVFKFTDRPFIDLQRPFSQQQVALSSNRVES